ncbi:MAG: hypothetical protein IKG32_06070 [Clostridia bacterium]|nr:hypothetical protein [Clostridia bacterium]
MKESKFYHEALSLSLLDGKAIKAALDKQIGNEPAKTHESVRLPWRRVVMIATACMVLTVATVMAIPSTRAEVLSWLGITEPSEYLSTDPDQRTPIEALDNMIATAKLEDTEIKVNEIDRTDSQAVNSEGAMRIAELLNQDIQITLGDTLFDGNTAYVTMHLKGTVALPLLDDYTGGSATMVQVDPQRVYDLYEGGPGEEYMSGKLPLFERPVASLVLELNDGSIISQFVQNMSETPAYSAYLDSLAKSFDYEHISSEDMEKISELNRAYLAENEIVSVVEIYCVREQLEKNVDADGTLQAKARYIMSVCEDDDLPNTELLNVDLGTVRFNVTGYQAMKTRTAVADGKQVVWKGDSVITCMELVDPQDHDKEATDWNTALQMYTNYPVSLDGMTLEALPGAYADDLGIYDLKVRISLPESMQGNARAAWGKMASMVPISFNILIDGQEGGWYTGGFGLIPNDDGTFTYQIVNIQGVALETIKDIRTVTLIPVLRYVTGFVGPDEAYEDLAPEIRTPQPQTTDGVWMGAKIETTAYPEYALTFTLG